MLNNLIHNIKILIKSIIILCNKFIGQIKPLFSKLCNKIKEKSLKFKLFIQSISLKLYSLCKLALFRKIFEKIKEKSLNFKLLIKSISVKLRSLCKLALFRKIFEKIKEKSFNLGSSSNLSLLEYIKSIKKIKIFNKIHQIFTLLTTGRELTVIDLDNHPDGVLGISVNQNNIILVHLTNTNLEIVVKSYKIIQLNNLDLNLQDPQEKLILQKEITEYVLANKISKILGSYVLLPTQYVISLVDLPNDNNTISERILWDGIKDYINYPINDVILDNFSIPVRRSKDNVQVSYAVAMRAKLSQNIAELLLNCDIKLKYIDIPELCIRNIMRLYPELNPIGLLVLNISDNYSKILLIKNDNLFITRITKINFKELNNFDPKQNDSTEKFAIAENLLLDFQRSLDYANNMFAGLNFNSICILPCSYNLDKLIDWLKEQSGLFITKLDLNKVIKTDTYMSMELQSNLLPSIGAAARNFEFNEQTSVATN